MPRAPSARITRAPRPRQHHRQIGVPLEGSPERHHRAAPPLRRGYPEGSASPGRCRRAKLRKKRFERGRTGCGSNSITTTDRGQRLRRDCAAAVRPGVDGGDRAEPSARASSLVDEQPSRAVPPFPRRRRAVLPPPRASPARPRPLTRTDARSIPMRHQDRQVIEARMPRVAPPSRNSANSAVASRSCPSPGGRTTCRPPDRAARRRQRCRALLTLLD